MPMPMPEHDGMPYLQCAYEIHVDEHGLVVALFAQPQLFLEAFQLVDRVVELGVGVAQLLCRSRTVRNVP